MVRIAILGQGLVATHLAVGLERIKSGELEPIGVPLDRFEYEIPVGRLEIVGSFDVDPRKVGKTLYQVAQDMLGGQLPVPRSLEAVRVERGIHAGSVKGLIPGARGLDEELGMEEAVEKVADRLQHLKPDVVINVITTEKAEPFETVGSVRERVSKGLVSASQAYALAVLRYAEREARRVALVNAIPAPLANDPAIVSMYESAESLVLGDDGATGATPLTADLLEHLAERNRRVLSIAQFNIGGNLDFLALTLPEKNLMKEKTKSSVVRDILGYDVPHFIKPTGYLEPLGDKKFVAMHIAWKTFNGLEDELVVNMRINDSPALAGLLVDLARISYSLLERGYKGTVYEVNAFFMKNPGPKEASNMARITAFHNLVKLLQGLGALNTGINGGQP
ncbi:inositol-3-phosphate synthase [Aeropyrum camini]|uniref:Inositol-3-phosphate synthase n=1 Tax=Aeropyrum camini SY1 = JCM 12091 TaxID=1198449 RepID=U3TA63_9CREN|nr:inositol-3-phosphate synthase [Aeropyrum camini]BAN90422.1 inositol-3-phosphate synthase [Aeropyrum camini SY1 = JCM 12091]